jgi:hypothetical protein
MDRKRKEVLKRDVQQAANIRIRLFEYLTRRPSCPKVLVIG